jgi:hypothetical protein
MTTEHTPQAAAKSSAPWALWLVLLAAAGAFALTMGTRQTMGLFLAWLNTFTGLGIPGPFAHTRSTRGEPGSHRRLSPQGIHLLE